MMSADLRDDQRHLRRHQLQDYRNRHPALACAIFGMQNSAHQFVKNIVVKWDTFAGGCAFDIFDEINPRIACATDRAIPDSPNNLFELLLLPGAVARILERYDLLHEIVEAI